jgi:hypothetical protein
MARPAGLELIDPFAWGPTPNAHVFKRATLGVSLGSERV